MKTKLLVWLLVVFLVFPVLSFAQMKPKSPVKTYYCVKVDDIFINPKDFSTNDKISVGVRLKFTKQSYIPGAPGQKLCNCAFPGPSGELTHAWTKTISLRLIGLKYSETETNVLEYYGPTPSFVPYTYSGFQVIGITITQEDLNKGVKDVWGWAPKKNPLKDNREFKIQADLDVNGYVLKRNDDPDYLKKGCFAPGNTIKTFKPRTLEVPKIDEEKIKKGMKKTEGVLATLPDLKIKEGKVYLKISDRENEQAVIYDEANIFFDILNSGRGDVSKCKVKIEKKWEGSEYYPINGSGYAYDEKSGKIQNGIIEVENIKANGGYKTIVIFVDNSEVPKADYWIRITVDPDNEVAELDESNNGPIEIYFPSHYKHPEYYQKK